MATDASVSTLFADPPFVKTSEGRPFQVVVLKEIKAYRFAPVLFFNPTFQANLRISLKNKNLPPKGGKLLFL